MVSTFPGKHTHSILLIIFVLSFIHVALLIVESLFPFTFAMLQTIFELTDIYAAIFPFVLALPIRFSSNIYACVAVPVGEYIRALSMFETIVPLTFIPIAIFPLMNTIARSF